MVSEKRIRAAAARAAYLIMRYGWAQGRSHLRGPARCATHAVCAADYEIAPNVLARCELLLLHEGKVRKLSGKRKHALARWNDTPGRTRKEVVSFLRRVSRGERARLTR